MSKIEWCDKTLNPIVGCSKISAGCENCYAEKFAARLKNNPHKTISSKYEEITDKNGKWSRKINCDDKIIEKAWRFKSPKRIFVGSMGDIFHENVPDSFLDQIWLKMFASPRCHTFLILTKRPLRMKDFVSKFQHVAPNIYLGVTAENQETADERIPILLETPAAKRFVSCEPMLSQIDIWKYFGPQNDGQFLNVVECGHKSNKYGINWVICGGETGPSARPVHPDWVRSLRDQCQETGVPFFFKHWGEWISIYDNDKDYGVRRGREFNDPSKIYRWLNLDGESGFHGERLVRVKKVGKKKAGHLIDGNEYREFPPVNTDHLSDMVAAERYRPYQGPLSIGRFEANYLSMKAYFDRN